MGNDICWQENSYTQKNCQISPDAHEKLQYKKQQTMQFFLSPEFLGSKDNKSNIQENNITQISIHNNGDEKTLTYSNYQFTWKSKNPNSKILQGYVKVFNLQDKYLQFQGQYKNSLRNGYGIEYNKNKDIIYQGQFKNDQYDGWGKTNVYCGEFRSGLYDGYGQLRNQQLCYVGYFRYGNFDGVGMIITGNPLKNTHQIKNLQSYIFILTQDDNIKKMHQHNIFQIYIGEWNQGLKTGHGKLWRANDYWYFGQFSRNLYHGLGTLHDLTISDGVIRKTFKNGQQIKN